MTRKLRAQLRGLAREYKAVHVEMARYHVGGGLYVGARVSELVGRIDALNKAAARLGYSLGENGKYYKYP